MRRFASVVARRLNAVVEYTQPQLRIREAPASNLGPKTGHPDGFSSFSSVIVIQFNVI
jgi:hypothetical protein